MSNTVRCMERSKKSCAVSEEIKDKLIVLHEAGYSNVEIAKTIRCSERTVRRYIARYSDMGEEGLLDWRQFNTGKRLTTAEEDHALVSIIEQDPSRSALDVAADLNITVSKHTVRRRLREAGFECRRSKRKVQLLQKHCKDNIVFALQHLPSSESEWDYTIFTDEKVFLLTTDNTLQVCRLQLEPNFNEKFIAPYDDSKRIVCSMWGWISAHGPGELVEISQQIDSFEYISILEDVLVPSVRAIYSKEDMPVIRLAQDNSALHTSAAVRSWIARNPDIQILQWPVRLSDLNIMEHIWTHMVETWQHTDIASSGASLVKHLICTWESLRGKPEFFEHLGKSRQSH